MKKFLRQLTPKDIRTYMILAALAIAGLWIDGYWGGVLTGATGAMLLLGLFGKSLAYRAVQRIDKQVKDVLTNQ